MPAKKKKAGTSKASAEAHALLFIEIYLSNRENATRAYMEAFGTENCNTAAVAAHHLLRDPKIQGVIEARRKEIRDRYKLTTERVMHELARVAYFNPKNMNDQDGRPLALHELDDDTAAALAAIEVEVGDDGTVRLARYRPFEKVTALDKASKILGLYEAPVAPEPESRGYETREELLDTARRLAFLLRLAAEDEQTKQLPAE